jgi:hypothetical protein
MEKNSYLVREFIEHVPLFGYQEIEIIRKLVATGKRKAMMHDIWQKIRSNGWLKIVEADILSEDKVIRKNLVISKGNCMADILITFQKDEYTGEETAAFSIQKSQLGKKSLFFRKLDFNKFSNFLKTR